MLKFKELSEQIENQKKDWLTDLKHVVGINNILAHQKHQDQAQMVQWVVQKLCKFNAVVEIIENVSVESDVVGPKIILADIKHNRVKQTLLIYGHIDTKEPPSKDIHSRLFDLVCADGKLSGHGIAHGKGPLLCWIHALEALQLSRQKLRVNIKFIIETHRTAESAQMEHMMRMRQRFFQNVKYVSVLERTDMSTKELPVVCSASPGCVHFVVELERTPVEARSSQSKRRSTVNRNSSKPAKQPLQELVQLLDGLTDEFGKLHLPREALRSEIVGDSAGGGKREPRLSMHEVKGDFMNSSGAPKPIPPHVTGKFSIEFGPTYNGRSISTYICSKLDRLYRKMSGTNTLILTAERLMQPCQLKRDANVNLKTLESAMAYMGNEAIYFAPSHRPHYVGYLLREYTKCEVLVFNLFSPPEETESTDEVEYIKESDYWSSVKQLAGYIWCLGTNKERGTGGHSKQK